MKVWNGVLTSARSSFRRANADLESFSYSVSHDLRAPLRAVDGFCQMFLDEFGAGVPPDGRYMLEKAQAGAARMGQLIDGLLRLARFGRQPLNLAPVRMNSLVQRVLAHFEGQLRARGVPVQVATLPDCVADGSLLEQVFTNLLSNALKFTAGRPQTRIEIGAGHDSGSLVYFVKDNGVGFDMRYAEHLFGVFQRLHAQSEFEVPGSACRSYSESYGSTADGPGPRARRNRARRFTSACRRPRMNAEVSIPKASEHIDLDVLLVEDSMPDAELAIWRLTQGGFRCRYRVVTREHELLAALTERLPSFILSDFSLPGFDGMAALATASLLAPDVPFIFLSARSERSAPSEALRRGAVDYVLKSESDAARSGRQACPRGSRVAACESDRRAPHTPRYRCFADAFGNQRGGGQDARAE